MAFKCQFSLIGIIYTISAMLFKVASDGKTTAATRIDHSQMPLVLCLIVEERSRCLGVSLLCLDGAQVYAPFAQVYPFREIVHTNSVLTHSCS